MVEATLAHDLVMTSITLQLPPDLLDQAQILAGSQENLPDFLVRAIAQEIQRQRCERTPANQAFWDNLLQARAQILTEQSVDRGCSSFFDA